MGSPDRLGRKLWKGKGEDELDAQRRSPSASPSLLASTGARHTAAMASSGTWVYWALLSAVFAALTAIFAKVAIHGVRSDLPLDEHARFSDLAERWALGMRLMGHDEDGRAGMPSTTYFLPRPGQ